MKTKILNIGIFFSLFLILENKMFSQNNRVWATFCGGPNMEQAWGVTTDAAGNVYLAGWTDSPTGVSSGGFQNTFGGVQDAYLIKLDAAGNRLWASYYGGSGFDQGLGVKADGLGNVYLCGTTASLTNVAVGGFQTTFGGAQDAFLVKFDATTGNLIWSTYYGGSGGENGFSVTTDAIGNVYLSGVSTSTNNIASGGFQNTYAGGGLNGDAFLVKFDAAGNRLWATYYGGAAEELNSSVTTDAAGNVFLVGTTLSTTNIASGGFQNTYGGGWGTYGDNFLVKFNAAGVRQWATYYGGVGDEGGGSVATDAIGNVYLAGWAYSATNIASGGFQNTPGGGGMADAYLAKFNGNGARLWATYYGGAGQETFMYQELAVDAAGNAYLSGQTQSVANIAFGGFQNNLVGTQNKFLVKFDPAGSRLCATYYGQFYELYGCVGVDNAGHVYIAGMAQSANNIASGGFQNTYAGGGDAFLVKFTSCFSNILSVSAASTNVLCFGQCTGTAAATPNGTSPYTYSWNTAPVQTTQTASGLCNGSYTVTVTDAALLTATAVVNITQPTSALTTTVIDSATTCGNNNGMATVTASGGTGAYTYLWSPSGGTGTTANGLAPGSYTITVTDANGCKDTSTAIIVTSSGVSVSTTSTAALCTSANGTAIATPSGGTPGYTYIWSPSGGTGDTAIGLVAGTYTVTVTDASGCTATVTANVTQSNGTLTATATSTSTLCTSNNGTATVTPLGGTAIYTYNWTPSGGTGNVASNLAAGTYTITVTDVNGCLTSTTTIVNQDNGNVSATSTTTPDLCNSANGTVTITVSGGTASYTYVWSPSVGTVATASSLANGTYTVLVTDANGCTQTVSATVTLIAGPTASVSPNVFISLGNSTSLTATGGGTYSWTPTTGLSCTTCANPFAIPNQTTVYCVEVTDSTGCKDTACVTVNVEIPCPSNENTAVPNAFSPNKDGVNDEFCLQGWDTCIEKFKIVIYNRWGEKVYETIDPNFCWDGEYKGVIMDAQVFVYYFKAKFANSDQQVNKKGNISLIK